MKKEEILEIIDEKNNPTGEAKPRALAHSIGLWHRTVHIYFFRRSGGTIEILVHLRSKTKDLNPDKWDTRFGGHIKQGENVEQTVIGEMKEEIGLNIEPANLIEGDWVKRNNHPNNEFVKVFYFEFAGDQKNLNFNDKEVQKVKWLPTDGILKLMEKEPKNWSGEAIRFQEVIKSLENKLKNKRSARVRKIH